MDQAVDGQVGPVTEMCAPRWRKAHSVETVTRDPAWPQVEAAVRRLDGAEVNDLYLRTSEPESFMGICGGSGRYMVTISVRNERFAQALNLSDPSDEEELIVCGGQLSSFPRRFLVDLNLALTAARGYLARADAAPDLFWEWY